MQLTQLLAQHVTDVYNGNNWTDVNIATTLENIDWKQAQQQTEASPNTIASLVHHMLYWNGIIMQRNTSYSGRKWLRCSFLKQRRRMESIAGKNTSIIY